MYQKLGRSLGMRLLCRDLFDFAFLCSVCITHFKHSKIWACGAVQLWQLRTMNCWYSMKFSSTYVKPHEEKFLTPCTILFVCTSIFMYNDVSSCLYHTCCHVGSLTSLRQSVQPMGRLAMVVARGRIHPFMSSHVPLCTVTNNLH